MDELEVQAMKLDPKDRARLASKLLRSLEGLSQPEIEAAWAEEAERRAADADAHPDSLLSADDVLRETRARLR
jgi:putative addiction module component (TIGR02574 family)